MNAKFDMDKFMEDGKQAVRCDTYEEAEEFLTWMSKQGVLIAGNMGTNPEWVLQQFYAEPVPVGYAIDYMFASGGNPYINRSALDYYVREGYEIVKWDNPEADCFSVTFDEILVLF